MYKLCLLAAVIVVAFAEPEPEPSLGLGHYGYRGAYYRPGLKVTGVGAVAPYNNAARQKAVNSVAHSIGRGTGTAYREGVAGAGEVHLVNKGQYAYRGHGYGYGAPYKGGYYGYDAGYGYAAPVYGAYHGALY